MLQWHVMSSTWWTSRLEFRCKLTVFVSITPGEITWEIKISFLDSLISSCFITASLSIRHHVYMRNLHIRTQFSFVWWRNDKETVNLSLSLSLSLSANLSNFLLPDPCQSATFLSWNNSLHFSNNLQGNVNRCVASVSLPHLSSFS